jgi:hypothetical protein
MKAKHQSARKASASPPASPQQFKKLPKLPPGAALRSSSAAAAAASSSANNKHYNNINARSASPSRSPPIEAKKANQYDVLPHNDAPPKPLDSATIERVSLVVFIDGVFDIQKKM